MTITVTPIPEHVRAQLSANQHFVAIAVRSWGESAAATNQLIQSNFLRMQEPGHDADERAFLGWEILTAAVELSEILASALMHDRDPQSAPFHSVDNPTLNAFFEGVRDFGLSAEHASGFLRFRVPSGLGRAAIRVASIHGKVVSALQESVRETATFWCTHAEKSARWFRHLPLSLSNEEALTIAPDAGPDRDIVLAKIAAIPDRIETLVRVDEETRSFEHTALSLDNVRVARAIANVTSQLIVNWIATSGFDSMTGPNQRWLFPTLTYGLTPDEKKVLERDGHYIIA
jgi:hypothetical protein